MRSKVVRRGVSLVVVGAALVVAGCSSTSTQVSDEIASQVKDKLELSTEPAVTCPDDAKADKGETFTCEIDLDEGTVPVKVTFEDSTNFTTEIDGAVYKKAALDKALKADLEKNGLTLKTLDCKGGDLVVFKAKDTVSCTATTSDGATGAIKVHLDADNNAETVGSVYEQTALATFLTDQLADQVTITAVDCGEDALIQAEEDLQLDCEATADDGTTATLKVTLSADGTATLDDVVTG
ncbi:MAG: hypothetical protein JWO77_1430 [Ilumatobacteraceae bacterium]|nr:hypothetical protein [Ilumatobacteraceae bacterium]